MSEVYRFGAFELDAKTGELRKSGVRIKLGGQPLEVLALLVQRQGELVTREELKEALWKEETFTDFDHGVNTAVQRIRRALGDSATSPRFVETLPRKGYRFVAPVDTPTPTVDDSPSEENEGERRPSWRIAIATLAAAAIAVGFAVWPDSAPTTFTFTERALTSTMGEESYARFSPDGTRFVYSWDGGSAGPHDIYISLVEQGAGEPVRVTDDPRNEIHPASSPDGSHIVFARRLESQAGYRFELVLASPTAGGAERVLTEFATRGNQVFPEWHPDGRHIAFSCKIDAPRALRQVCIYSLDSEETWPVTTPTGTVGDGNVKFHPDGRAIAYLGSGELFFLKLTPDLRAAGERVSILPDSSYPSVAGWSDSEVYLIGLRQGLGYGLWAVPLDGEPRLVRSLAPPHAGVQPFPSIWWTPSGGMRIVYQGADRESEIMRIRLTDTNPKPTPLTRANRPDFNPAYSPDGSRIAFISSRSGVDALWVCDRDGMAPTVVSELGRFAGYSEPRWSPNSERIALDAIFQTVGRDVYVFDVASKRVSPPLTSGGGRSPVWSQDGRSLYYNPGRLPEIWKIDVKTLETELLLEGVYRLTAAPGSNFYYSASQGRISRLTLDEGKRTPDREVAVEEGAQVFTVGRKALYWRGDDDVIYARDHKSGRSRELHRVEGRPVNPRHRSSYGIAVSPDETELLYTNWIRDEPDLRLLESVK